MNGMSRLARAPTCRHLWARPEGVRPLRLPSRDLPPLADAPIDLDRLAAPLEAIVREAGEIALRFFRGGGARSWVKGDDSPVTEADIAVDSFLAENLPRLVEGSGWLSEETADTPERRERRRVWIVDPIDGTRAFVENRPEWVVSVGLVEDGAPVAGVVHNPCADETFVGLKGRGATRNGRALQIADNESLDGVVVGGPNSLLGPLKARGVRHGPWLYALANRLVQVAGGGLGAAVARPNAHDWDIAAADIILAEAGGTLIGFDGAAPVYNRASTRHGGLIAAGPKRAQIIASALAAVEVASSPET